MRPDPYDVRMDKKLEDEFTELVQKLYNEDGHCGNIYKKAPVALLRYYEEKAWERSKNGCFDE